MEKYIATIKVGNFNTGVHYTKTIEFASSGKEGTLCDDLKKACREVVPYNACWWVVSLEMTSKDHFFAAFK